MVISELLQNNKDISLKVEFLKSQHVDRCFNLLGELVVMKRNFTEVIELLLKL
jgi:hypothetical protein